MARKLGMKYQGTETYIKASTGECVEVEQYVKYVGRTDPFMITYMSEILKLCDVIGNKKMVIVKYIIKEMNKSNNILNITTTELAKNTKTSRQTVSDTLKILEEADIIRRRIGSIMVNPKLINNKRASCEQKMIIEFKQYGRNDET